MNIIELVTIDFNDNKKIRRAKPEVQLDEIDEIAHNEVSDGYCKYSAVLKDGEIYSEYEV